MKKLAILFAIPLMLVACSSGNDKATPVDANKVNGVWQQSAWKANGKTLKNSDMEKRILVIKDNKVYIGEYNRQTGEVDLLAGVPVKIENNVITNVDPEDGVVPAQRIVAVTDTELQLDHVDDEDSDPASLITVYERVSEADAEKILAGLANVETASANDNTEALDEE